MSGPIQLYRALFGKDSEGEAFSARPYQEAVAARLRERRNIVLTAPTGAGKTLAVLAPFLAFRDEIGARRMIYCLPMKTLAQGIHAEAQRVARLAGLDDSSVTLQTGDHQGDPFFLQGDIIVCTYDQLLSSLLCGSYSLSPSQQNINAAAVAGNLVVFDEFHLMEVGKAFMTGITCMRLFKECCRSVWMTATATDPLTDKLVSELDAVAISLTEDEGASVERDRSILKVERTLAWNEVLPPDSTIGRTLVVVNTVKRSQDLFEALLPQALARGIPVENLILLHSRFFSRDKESKRKRLYELFGKDSAARPAILVATQVVEAGLDISAERLLTDLCPMNALIQRAGRCARFEGQRGTVAVYRWADFDAKPYLAQTLDATWNTLPSGEPLTNRKARDWTNQVHEAADRNSLRASTSNPGDCREIIQEGMKGRRGGGVSDLIRTGSATIEVFIMSAPGGVRPGTREGIAITRRQFYGFVRNYPGIGSQFDPDASELWVPLKDPKAAYFAALPPKAARYTYEMGLKLAEAGSQESPEMPPLPAWRRYEYRRETWITHTAKVEAEGRSLLKAEARGLLAKSSLGAALSEVLPLACRMHDVGKLQHGWQQWVRRYETSKYLRCPDDELLAHTECITDKDRQFDREAGKRPPHSTASAVYGAREIKDFDGAKWCATMAAIVSHHGGWFSSQPPVDTLDVRASRILASVGFGKIGKAEKVDTAKDNVEGLMAEQFEEYWPLTAMTVRLLRLADQKATKEGSES